MFNTFSLEAAGRDLASGAAVHRWRRTANYQVCNKMDPTVWKIKPFRCVCRVWAEASGYCTARTSCCRLDTYRSGRCAHCTAVHVLSRVANQMLGDEVGAAARPLRPASDPRRRQGEDAAVQLLALPEEVPQEMV